MNSDNGGGEIKKDEPKRKKRRETKSGGPKFQPPHLKLSQKLSQLSQTELTQSTQKKISKFSSIFQTPNLQFKIWALRI